MHHGSRGHVLKNTMRRFIAPLFFLFLSGCVFSPPDDHRISDSIISSVRENEIDIKVTEAVDQMGLYYVTDVYTQTYHLNDIEIYDGYKVGDRISLSFPGKRIRITNMSGASFYTEFYVEPQLTFEGIGEETHSR